jgi:polysaccharide deacetylase family protein (PEP-CTERM system associated)
MNILTFDVEDWYNCDFISGDFDWDKFEYCLDKSFIPVLDEMDKMGLKSTCFCLGWLAEKHPDIIREISNRGHQIGCHSYQHELSFRFDKETFIQDTLKAKRLLEDVIGKEVVTFRAPGFSITEKNTWAIDCLIDMGFKYDYSVFPAAHDYGGMPNYGASEPTILKTKSGNTIKEFPINIHSILGKNIVFSGGGFFRIFPYPIIKNWAKKSPYLMTYFHPREFDPNTPKVESLPLMRKIKTYINVEGNFNKWKKLMNDFSFVNIEEADKQINWYNARTIQL